jgi:hypothetical protein
MTQEDKELLLQDLCCRLPYGVKVHRTLYGAIELNERQIESFRKGIDDMLIPYLRPMSSMTEEEEIYYNTVYTRLKFYEKEDWLNAHHFDMRNLIEKGLAIAVTEENNPYKE